MKHLISIFIYALLVWVSVCFLDPINVETAEPIEPNIFEATLMTKGIVEKFLAEKMSKIN